MNWWANWLKEGTLIQAGVSVTIAVLAAQAALSEYHRLEALKPQMLVFSCSGGKSKIRVQASLAAQLVKNPPAMQETQVQSLGWEDPLEEGMAINSNILAWRMPWTEEPGYSP